MSPVSFLIAVLLGLVAGGVVNALADDLPRRRKPRLPHYFDDTPRPITAWLGLTAFLFGQREAPNAKGFSHRYWKYFRKWKKNRRKGNGLRVRRHWFYSRGRRRGLLPTKLGWRYPLTELMTIGLMLLAFAARAQRPADNQVSDIQFVFWLIYMAIFALIIVIDVEHKLILFAVIIPSVVITLLDALIAAPPSIVDALIGGVGAFIAFFLLYNGGFLFTYIMGKIRRRKIREVAFGYGDVMLAGVAGLMLGWQWIILALVVTIILGALGALVYLVSRRLVGRRYSAFTAIPYGPYIVIGTLLTLLYPAQVLAWLVPGAR